MRELREAVLRRFRLIDWRGYAAALVAVALVSIVIAAILQWTEVANISMLYLIAVLTIAIAFGSGPAVVASVAAFLTFDFLFVVPRHTFTVADPEEWISLLLFLVSAIITGQLAASQRQRARDAEDREREAVVLYDVVRLINDPDLSRALRAVAERLRCELGLSAVAIDLADAGIGVAPALVGEPEGIRLIQLAAIERLQVLGEGRAPTDVVRGAPGRWVRVVPAAKTGAKPTPGRGRLYVVSVKAGEHRAGTLSLAVPEKAPGFRPVEDRLLSAIAAQLAVVVERARLREAATDAEVLRRTDELKTALLNAVSHDLRTPLASIVASAGSLRQKDVEWTESERDEFAEAIEEEAQRLNRIVSNLLDLSRIEGGTLWPARSWYDVAELVHDVVSRLRPVVARHRVIIDVPDDLPPVLLDSVQIDQSLSNLIENAAKYAPAGTEITVRVSMAGAEIRISVLDEGPGIPRDALPRLFAPFYRVDGRAGHQPKGLGLGLSVARGLVEAHGGRIWAENRPTGGACFTIALPVESVPAVPEGRAVPVG